MSTFPLLATTLVHAPWQPAEIVRATFARYLLLTGHLSDGESVEQLAATRKLQHVFDGRERPANWQIADERAFLARPVLRPADARGEPFDPASASRKWDPASADSA